MIYAKEYQSDATCTYYKLNESDQSIIVETIRFLTPVPQISFAQYDHSDCIEVEAILTNHPRISEEEYRMVYRQVTAGRFDIDLPR